MKKNKSFQKLGLMLILAMVGISSMVSAQTFYNSDGSKFEAKSHYPNFSWDVTPQYFMFSSKDRVLTSEESDFISSKTGFICIEKNHARDQLGGAEYGTKAEVAAFKSRNPEAKVLFYFNALVAYPFSQWTENFWPNNIERYPYYESLLMHNSATGELQPEGGSWYFYDILNPEFRSWWVDTVVEAIALSNADGIFIDKFGNGAPWLRPDDEDEQLQSAFNEMFADLRASLPADKIILGNDDLNNDDNIPKLPFIDAGFFENNKANTLTKEAMLDNWEAMLEGAKNNKIMVFRIGVDVEYPDVEEEVIAQFSKEKLEYYLASYLIGAQPYTYFQYGWGWNLNTGPLVDYPELLKPLGAPLEAYNRTSNSGWEFTRKFEHASVWLDTEAREAKITWEDNTIGFTPDPNKTYYIDVPYHNLRLSADGEKEFPETVSTNSTGADVEWKFVAKGNGSWHIQRAAGGTVPRLRTDNSANADMQAADENWNGAYTYYDFTEGATSGTYFITLPRGPANFKRLQVNNSGAVKMVKDTRDGTWESFTFTEAAASISGNLVHITKRNATGWAFDGGSGGDNRQAVSLQQSNTSDEDQLWIEIDRGDGYYSYQKYGTNYCIDGNLGGAKNQAVYLWKRNDTNYNQQWKKVAIGDGGYKLIKRNASGFALNGGSGGQANRQINLWDSSNSSQNLQWYITPVSSSLAVNYTSYIDDGIENVSVYPNPVKNTLIITFNDTYDDETTIILYTINGQKVMEAKPSNEVKLEMSKLNAGIYILKVKTNLNTIIKKIVKT